MVRTGLGEFIPTKVCILVALVVQCVLFCSLNYGNSKEFTIQSLRQEITAYEVKSIHDNEIIRKLDTTVRSLLYLNQSGAINEKSVSPAVVQHPVAPTPLEGVALLLMTDQPKWFQRRYSLLIQNLLSNLPSSWVVQIFHPDSKQYHAGVLLNPGFKRLIDSQNPRVHLTQLPTDLIKSRKRPIHIMLHPFIWENTLAEKVLYLDGNHVLCANSPFTIEHFLDFDYVGAPGWGMFKGQAGGGGISLRNSSAMLRLIEHELAQTPAEDRPRAHEKWGRDDEFFVSRMIKQNKASGRKGSRTPYVLASKEVQQQFSSSRGVATFDAFSVSGTLPHVSWEDRSEVINYCPELKTIFPSLHEPACFGADVSKTRETCAASICALKPEKKSC